MAINRVNPPPDDNTFGSLLAIAIGTPIALESLGITKSKKDGPTGVDPQGGKSNPFEVMQGVNKMTSSDSSDLDVLEGAVKTASALRKPSAAATPDGSGDTVKNARGETLVSTIPDPVPAKAAPVSPASIKRKIKASQPASQPAAAVPASGGDVTAPKGPAMQRQASPIPTLDSTVQPVAPVAQATPMQRRLEAGTGDPQQKIAAGLAVLERNKNIPEPVRQAAGQALVMAKYKKNLGG